LLSSVGDDDCAVLFVGRQLVNAEQLVATRGTDRERNDDSPNSSRHSSRRPSADAATE
jgi:hypothetical protein